MLLMFVFLCLARLAAWKQVVDMVQSARTERNMKYIPFVGELLVDTPRLLYNNSNNDLVYLYTIITQS